MIINKNGIIDAIEFMNGIQNALPGVLRIATKGQFSTGWLLTDKLVLIPDVMASENAEYICYPNSSSPQVGLKAILLKRFGENNSIAILELTDENVIRAQVLQTENPEVDDPILVLHHPQGLPNIQVSFGKILDRDELWLDHNADTQPGSTGGPLINARNGKVIGMHLIALRDQQRNRAMPLSRILDLLRNTTYWDSIISYHGLADTRETTIENIQEKFVVKGWEPIHYQAALSWNIKKDNLSDQEKNMLMPYVINPKSTLWFLKSQDRQLILESLPLTELRKLSKDIATDHPGQRVIDRILKGGPYNLENEPVDDLPYWLQAVRWFSTIDKSLPGSSEVNQVLERKRIRSRLAELGGPDFKGRVIELEILHKWYKNENAGPLVISGIGGIGKSALISHFNLELPENTILLWLDFDRVDLAADNANSVLRILSEQLTVQLPGLMVSPETKDWKIMAGELAENFNRAVEKLPPPILVLDGFEVAQHQKQYQEIWKLLEVILEKCPKLKIIVSGRAHVKNLSLLGKKAESLALGGMEQADAIDFLEQHGIKGKGISDRIAEMSRGIPLILKLAVHYVSSGGSTRDLIKEMPQTLIEGYLYQRILDRVMDQQLKPLAKEALILRKVTPEIIRKVLYRNIPADSDPDKVFESLSRELALVTESDGAVGMAIAVSQSDTLQLRPEVRTSTIKLLESEDPAFVKDVDQRAADFYRDEDASAPENVAELIYHLLRSGQLPEAQKIWRTECAQFLKNSVEDLPENLVNERTWLKDMIDKLFTEEKDDIVIWELNTLSQVKNLLARGLYRGVAEMLKQRTERSENSPLILYDAWMAWITGNVENAKKILENSKATDPKIKKNELIILALMEYQYYNTGKADQLLSEISIAEWYDKRMGNLENLAIQAARVRFTVDIEMEIDLIQKLTEGGEMNDALNLIDKFIDPRDLVLPTISEKLEKRTKLESYGSSIMLPLDEKDRAVFQSFEKKFIDFHSADLETFIKQNKERLEKEEGGFKTALEQIIVRLSLLSAFRWRFAASTPVLADFALLAVGRQEFIYPMELSIIASLAAFRGQEMVVFIESFSEPSIDMFLNRVVKNNPQTILPSLSPRRRKILDNYLKEVEKEFIKLRIRDSLNEVLQHSESDMYSALRFISNLPDERIASILLFLIGPDPLEMLCRRIIGIPDKYKIYFSAVGMSQNVRLKLIEIGTTLVPMKEELQMLLAMTGINTAMISFTGSAYAQWVSVVEYLETTGQLAQFIVELSKRFEHNPQLKNLRDEIFAGSAAAS